MQIDNAQRRAVQINECLRHGIDSGRDLHRNPRLRALHQGPDQRGRARGAELFVANAEGDGSNFTYYPYGPFATLDDQRAWIASVSGSLSGGCWRWSRS